MATKMPSSKLGATQNSHFAKNIIFPKPTLSIFEEEKDEEGPKPGWDMTKTEWEELFARQEAEIDYITTSFERMRHDVAVKDCTSLLETILHETKLDVEITVNNFFALYPALKPLKSEIKVVGFRFKEAPWWAMCDNDKSLFYFRRDGSVRQFCGKSISNPWYEPFILLCIFGNTAQMAIDSPVMFPDGSTTSDMFDILDLIFNIIFTLEAIMQMIWYNLYFHKTAYLSDGWGKLDFAIVIFSWLSYIDGLPNLKPFRAFRSLRALKGIKYLAYCAAVMDALAEALPSFADVLSVMFFMGIIFGIMGVQLFKCILKDRCVYSGPIEDAQGLYMEPEDTSWCGQDNYGANLNDDKGFLCPQDFRCIRGENPAYGYSNFDDVGMALFTLFQMITLEGWNGVMKQMARADIGWSQVYFITAVLIFAFIIINLFIAVITNSFVQIRRARERAEQAEMLRIGVMEIEEKPQGQTEQDSGNGSQKRNPAELPHNLDSAVADMNVHINPINEIKKEQEGTMAGDAEHHSGPLRNAWSRRAAQKKTKELLSQIKKEEDHVLYPERPGHIVPTGPHHQNEDVALHQIDDRTKLERFLKGLALEQYIDVLMQLVDTPQEIVLLSLEDLTDKGVKVAHARRILEEASRMPVRGAYDGYDPHLLDVPVMPLPADCDAVEAAQVLQLLEVIGLQKYHGLLMRQVDTMNELLELNEEMLIRAGMKGVHTLKLLKALKQAKVMRSENDPIAQYPLLVQALGGKSQSMWYNDVAMSWPELWGSKFGQTVLHVWYRSDPVIDEHDPEPPLPRTKFIEPYQFHGKFGQLIANPGFEALVNTCIVLNIMTMSMEYYKMEGTLRLVLDIFEVTFFCVFASEMVFKWLGMGGLSWYFSSFSNVFDCLLVATAFPAIISIITGADDTGVNLSMLRVFRLFRLFRLLRHMRQLIDVVMSSAMAISNLLVFIAFAVMIFAIFGMQSFGGNVKECEDGECETPRANFDNFPQSIVCLFQVLTGEDWTDILYNVMNSYENGGGTSDKYFGAIFMYIFYVFANYVLMEMFTAVILENFCLKAEEKQELQQQLWDRKMAKQRQEQELAAALDKEMRLLDEQKKKEDDERESRAREALARAKAAGLHEEVDEETRKKKEEAEKLKREEEARQRAAEVKAKILAEQKSKDKGGDLDDYEYHSDEEDGEGAVGMIEDDNEDSKSKKPKTEAKFVEKSCCYFERENKLREICIVIANAWQFEWFIILIIVISSCMLAADTPYKTNQTLESIASIANPCFLSIFCVESAIKIVAMGFTGAPTAYIQDGWNRLDFFTVCISVFFEFLSGLPDGITRTLRVIRCLRPLRMINKNPRVKIVFTALQLSAPAILNVMFLGIFLIFLFSVMGLNIFMGLFWSCNDDQPDKNACVGTFEGDGGFPAPVVWSNPHYHFDNIFGGILTLIEVSSLEGWLDVMYSCMDTTSEDNQPVKDSSAILGAFFIVLFICLGPFFVLNMVIGVIIEKFNQVSGRGLLTDEQKLFKDTILHVMIADDNPIPPRPEAKCQAWCHDKTTSPAFEQATMYGIVGNTLVMMMEWCDQPSDIKGIVDVVNTAFVFLFATELVMRMIAQSPKVFFVNAWNIMDTGVVGMCLLVIPLGDAINVGALRSLRLLMVFRLIRRAKGIKLMFSTLAVSMPALANVGALMFLLIFVYTIAGIQLFALTRYGEGINAENNFRTFAGSLVIMIRSITGEGWPGLMKDIRVSEPLCTQYSGFTNGGWGDVSQQEADYYDYVTTSPGLTVGNVTSPPTVVRVDSYYLMNDCGSDLLGLIFFLSYHVLSYYIMLNLFIAVVLDNFAFCANVGTMEISDYVLDKYKQLWTKYTVNKKTKSTGKYLRLYYLKAFMSDLGSPLGVTIWDKDNTYRYKLIQEECRRCQVEGMGITYRKLLYVFSLYSMGLELLPLEDLMERSGTLERLAEERAARLVQAIWRAKKARQRLGIVLKAMPASRQALPEQEAQPPVSPRRKSRDHVLQPDNTTAHQPGSPRGNDEDEDEVDYGEHAPLSPRVRKEQKADPRKRSPTVGSRTPRQPTRGRAGTQGTASPEDAAPFKDRFVSLINSPGGLQSEAPTEEVELEAMDRAISPMARKPMGGGGSPATLHDPRSPPKSPEDPLSPKSPDTPRTESVRDKFKKKAAARRKKAQDEQAANPDVKQAVVEI